MIILKTFIMIILHHVTADNNELFPKLLKGYSISTKKRC